MLPSLKTSIDDDELPENQGEVRIITPSNPIPGHSTSMNSEEDEVNYGDIRYDNRLNPAERPTMVKIQRAKLNMGYNNNASQSLNVSSLADYKRPVFLPYLNSDSSKPSKVHLTKSLESLS